MLKSSAWSAIRLRGVRHNNLKNFDLDLPLKKLIVITGLSGSGKSSLAFDTLFAEGQRRYIETFSPYARQFFDRMDKPQVDGIEGIPPAIAIEQRNSVRTTRSTIGTMTEICDYMKLLWPHIAGLHCRKCGKPVRKDTPQSIFETLRHRPGDWLITFEVPLTQKLSLADSLALVARQGYQRLLLENSVVRIEEALAQQARLQNRVASLVVIQDRISPDTGNRPRFVEACEQAYHFGKGKLALVPMQGPNPAESQSLRFSNWLHCAECDIEYREPSAALFSFNHPLGACPTCRGFGRVISIDYNLALPDRTKTLAQGVVRPWLTGLGAECQTDLLRMCRHFEIPTDVPFERLPKKWQDFVINGEPDYGTDEEHEWPRAWYGIKGYFRWLESKAYKMHVRVLLSRYRAYTRCPDCQGQRFQPEALLYLLKPGLAAIPSRTARPEVDADPVSVSGFLNLAGFYALPIRDALPLISGICAGFGTRNNDPVRLAAEEVRCRLGYLDEVGLGYLTLDRPTRSLSGGETERVNLTTCLGTRLVNALFVLDEPSVGLHPRDTQRLVRVLEHLRDAGNTVVVVEHEAGIMNAADQIVDLGPGHGSTGGSVVFQGPFSALLQSPESLTGQYLSGRNRIEVPPLRSVARKAGVAGTREHNGSRMMALRDARFPYRAVSAEPPRLKLTHATLHNLEDLTVEIPLGRFVCVTGVSGSGKTTLIREVLLPLLAAQLKRPSLQLKASDRIAVDENGEEEADPENGAVQSAALEGAEHLGNVVLVDQATLGKTPRSNPAVYIGAFDSLRELFAQSEIARQRGLNASAFSFNSSQGQCQRCRGAGFEKIEMQFLSDVFIRCPDCDGHRYREHILEVKISPPNQKDFEPLSIADLLDSTVEEAIRFVAGFGDSRPARNALQALRYLADVGLGYLKLGQPINTLSGGESQRLKLVRYLADSAAENNPTAVSARSLDAAVPTLFLFDEPTTGLHFDDIRILLGVFQRLVDQGHSVLVIEHNLEVIKCADWIIDLGPEAGDRGGKIVAEGTPRQIAACEQSHTGRALRDPLPRTAARSRKSDRHEEPAR